ncbi:MAG: DUF1553 domain-containing protein [Bryobacteraceae bacterium]|nr:DUF1553 domain-containing protein [Bryobacteraceae bacterium]
MRRAIALAFAVWLGIAEPASVLTKADEKVLARKSWWSFRPPVRPAVPAIQEPWVRTPVDAFILKSLREKGWAPSPALPRAQLIRRLTLDVTGLPPTPAEVSAFIADRSPQAYEKLVDRLLASPAYGERWGQKWLDVVRYADTNGFELDLERAQAWRYRDYVIRSFNQNKPYDQFLKEQIAGDEIWPGNHEARIATGFLRAGPEHLVGGNTDKEMDRQEVLVEMTAAVGGAFLGLTMNCARCHNHKFDPILQADYYQLQAIFAGAKTAEVEIVTPDEKKAAIAALQAHLEKVKPIHDQLQEIEKPYREQLKAEKKLLLAPHLRAVLDKPIHERNEEEKLLAKDANKQTDSTWDEVVNRIGEPDKSRRKALRRQMHELELIAPPPVPAAYGVENMEEAPVTHILKVGDHKMKLAPVEPAVPLAFAHQIAVPAKVEGRRKALAEWLAAPEHPLTARVMVNRIWQARMGAGLVRTMNDFGALGERPTHPALLDWLATEFVAQKWNVKAMDRLILLSSVYQQTATLDAEKIKTDADNKLYWRAHRRRMDAEMLRDNLLALSGELNAKPGGPPVRVPIEPELYELIFTEQEPDNLWPLVKDTTEFNRRSIYLLNKRTVRLPMMTNFDQPDAMSSCPQRASSTHALQSLSLMNSSFTQDRAKALAARLTQSCGTKQACQLDTAYQLALARAPRPVETGLAQKFFREGGKLEEFCLALMNRHEFVYLP